MDKAEHPIQCEMGGIHQLTYLGKELQSYRCEKCGKRVSKSELKEETEK